jgi:septal ring factor EnvC (AmiA/AmiB activator)
LRAPPVSTESQMPDDTLEQEIAELSARIATAEEELRQFREDITTRASRNVPIYDDLIRAAEMQRLQDKRKELLEALERRRSG